MPQRNPLDPNFIGDLNRTTNPKRDKHGRIVTPERTSADARRAPADRKVNAQVSARERAQIWKMGTRQRQDYLRRMGYNVKVDGVQGPQTFAAAWAFVHGHSPGFYNSKGADWQHTVWNMHQPQAKTSHDPKAAHGNTQPPANAKKTNNTFGPPKGHDAAPPGIGIGALGTETGTPVDPRLGTKVGREIPLSWADAANSRQLSMAGATAGYDAPIRGLENELTQQSAQAKSNLQQIGDWYADVQAAQGRGAAANKVAGEAAVAGADAATQGVLASLGGEANAGAGEIAASGNAAAATLRALSANTASTDQEIGALLGAEGAGARTRQIGTDAATRRQISQALAEARGTKAQASYQAQLDAEDRRTQAAKDRFEERMAITQHNDTIQQQREANRFRNTEFNTGVQNQRFQNRIAAQGALIAAAAARPDIGMKELQYQFAQADPYSAFAPGVASAAARAKGQKGKGNSGAWARSSAASRGKANADALALATGMMDRGSSVQEVVAGVNNVYRARGWSTKNPAVARAAMATLQQLGIVPDPRWYGLG